MIDRFLLAGAPATVGGTPRRLLQLYAGLALYGASMALLVRSALGVMPWDVLHQGLAGRLGWSLGAVTIAVGALVLLAWIPLRQRPGLGTVSNVLVIGLAVDATLAVLPAPTAPAARAGFLVAGVLLNAVATAAYIGVHLGPGPRDGLMTGLVLRTGRSVRLVRTSVEIGVVATGWLLGGTLGVGTVVYALAIGPLVQVLLPRLSLPLAGSVPATQPDGHGGGDGEHEQRDRPAAAAGPCREDQQ
ncbi:Uncharacterized membrane protein YczE [Blastococcus sp. DSM 46786]|uniref:membrane protein YczE n=1 Tax=Blastococcus sp. DSM 46786 TaxID=1798227 RepID=UPI0008C2BCFF|nr:hypothetical protein [Blastococcus sp. DSM 46786]SEL81326.1 Uncharacterized membrane protein YczE [Blastococcus sp. DSM 46786]